MDRSLLSAVSGIDANQTWLDVIGSNISNSNTTGYKQDTVVFDDLLDQQVTSATAPTTPSLGGVNGIGVGTGTRVAAITPDETQGTLQQTNNPSDVFIQGNGYIVANVQGTPVYSRDGNLQFDSNGNLVTPTGGLVQGWQATPGGVINTTLPIQGIQIPVGLGIAPKNTANVNLGGNLPANQPAGVVETATVTVYDQQGNALAMTLKFTSGPVGSNLWTMTGSIANDGGFAFGPVNVQFNGAGVLQTVNGVGPNAQGVIPFTVTPITPDGAGGTMPAFNLNFPATAGGQNNVTQFDTAGKSSLQALSQDGFATGTLASLSFGSTGIITGSFTNGQSLSLGQIALATFANPTGLKQVGNNNWVGTANSGIALVNVPGTGGAGTIVGGALEASNVDMSQQLVNLVVAQTSYQANTRVVTTNATVLNSLIQMA